MVGRYVICDLSLDLSLAPWTPWLLTVLLTVTTRWELKYFFWNIAL